METIEITRRLAELNEHKDVCRAYQFALEEEQEPAVSMEAAIYILQFGTGDDYRISYSIFLQPAPERLFPRGHPGDHAGGFL